jgi:hypothetical protein
VFRAAASRSDRRVRRQVEILGQLEHPGIARIDGSGRTLPRCRRPGRGHPQPGRPAAAAAAVRGERQGFFRARLFETNSWNRNQVHRARFLRGEPDLGRLPAVRLLGQRR